MLLKEVIAIYTDKWESYETHKYKIHSYWFLKACGTYIYHKALKRVKENFVWAAMSLSMTDD
jgi:hypothetical protein